MIDDHSGLAPDWQQQVGDSLYRDGPQIMCVRQWSHYVLCSRQRWMPDMQAFAENPDHAMLAGVMLKDGDSTTVVRLEIDGRSYVVKRYNIRNGWYALRRLFRPSRAWRCWRNAHILLTVGIRTPSPVLMLERRWGPLRRQAYFVTDWVEGPDALQYLSEVPLNLSVWKQVLGLFGRFFADMRRHGLVHGDCKATNFIISAGELFVLDLDGMRQERSVRRFSRYFQRDLQRFRANWRHDEQATELINGLFSELNVKVKT
jgi:tRNA A-37 threonylcarbamoyl transferase component Bud32